MLDVSVKKTFGDFHIDASFSVGPGLTALFGPSGAGKTAIAKMLGGLETPDEGHIQIGDRTLFNRQKAINVPVQERNIGFVFQEHRLFPHYSVRGNLNYGQRNRQAGSGSVTFKDVVDLLGIGDLLARRPGSLSLGEQQRVAIGRALLSNPDFLVMDEPLSSLDSARKKDIIPLISRMKSEFGLTIIYISHSLGEITRLADSLVLLDKGQVKGAGPIENIVNNLELIPYTGGFDAGSVLEATVVSHDPSFNMSEIETEGGPMFIPGRDHPVGSKFRVRIRARDVALSAAEPKDLSILNRFKGQIIDHRSGQAGMEELLLDVGFRLTARITRKSFEQMKLGHGSEVWALIKSVTIGSSELDIHLI
ncbi:MAG: molybdenum ABC transporter ATP-binding protein [Proteobacteria bacterium]|nr:molybdenum ABC transporter ATP-binding protein [Pseudomonadota bacterium]